MAWEFFSDDELRCKGGDCCGGQMLMDPAFMLRQVELRRRCGFPLIVSSAYRCPIHNVKESKTGPAGPHTTGQAIDYKVSRKQAHRLLAVAFSMGFQGIGVKQHGASRFIHLDDLIEPAHAPRPTVWSYP